MAADITDNTRIAPAAHDDPIPTVSVVIAAFNAEATLSRQLDALAGQVGGVSFEVVVALNRCTDNTRQIAERFANRLSLCIVDAPDRSSGGYARNVGVGAASGEMLLFCDADDVVDPRWVAEMTAALVDGNVDVVAGRLVVDRSAIPTWIYRAAYQSVDGKCLMQFGDARYAAGGAMGCRRSAFNAVGGFRPLDTVDPLVCEIGGEDTDLGIRLWQAGCTIHEAPLAVLHYSPRTTVRDLFQRLRRDTYASVALQIREQPVARSSLWVLVSRPLMTGGYALVMRREWRPGVLAALMTQAFYTHQARRQMLKPATR